MSGSTIVIAEIETICRQAAATPPAATGDFRPTAKQVYFFTLVWLLKQKMLFQSAEDCLNSQRITDLRDRAQQVAQHLAEWGMTVAALKHREAKEWELLRIQLEKTIRYYRCQPGEVKADALQEALLKIFSLLDKMIEGRKLDETEDIVALVMSAQTTLTNIYDFGSPFYAFAKRIARNELITHLRKENRQPIYPGSLEDLVAVLPTVSPPPLPEDEQALIEAQILQLKIDLTKLLEFTQSYLTAKPRWVVYQTLAAQPQFWRALTMTGLPTPEAFSSQAKFTTDLEIATVLGMTENSVRATRSQAKKRLQELDPILGLLLERLITRRDGSGKKELTEPQFNVAVPGA